MVSFLMEEALKIKLFEEFSVGSSIGSVRGKLVTSAIFDYMIFKGRNSLKLFKFI